ncbi:feruloyl-CoA synthase [Roseibium marinum]|uniref:Feruloyl-CoA synthase n=1 Tax=Roseibium marinum TaxID=281252 RepID=A0A2S3UT56_9HYPH|nr:feruloyl-CoA synthase [Roseibium marinum]POF30902.1 feruloyl-CoA synthase [Roseibium marinum]
MQTHQPDHARRVEAPLRPVEVWAPEITVRQNDDGVIYIEQTRPLPPYPDRITEPLLKYAAEQPERTLFAERTGDGGWTRISYAEALTKTRALGQYLLDAGLTAERPLVILSGNDLNHAVLALAAIHVGIPYAAISPAYSLISKDFARLKDIFDSITPGMIYAADSKPFEKAIAAVANLEDTRTLFGKNAPGTEQGFDFALSTQPTEAVEKAFDALTPDSVAKFLFTSGSTGTPKAVMNTHRMICSNQIMTRETFTYFKTEPPVLLSWAPWHHTAAGNKEFFIPLFSGGSFYLDHGNPTPQGIKETVRNLKDVSPTWYFNVPKGFEALIPYLEADGQLRRNFFKDLKMLWYAGASMAQHTWDDLERLAAETLGQRILLATGLGATETAPACLMCTWPVEEAGNVGLPGYGVQLKLVPQDGKLDARVRGPNIMPGYWKAPEVTARSFDEEGYYCFGDALRFADPDDMSAGFFFDGRTAENFKLDTGTWVSTGALRTAFINHFGTIVRDVAIAGADRPYLAALVFPNVEELHRLTGLDEDAAPAALFAHPAVVAIFRDKLTSLASQATGSSTLIRKLVLMDPPPSPDAGEITDKGSVNQRKVLSLRAATVDALYEETIETIGL